MRPTALSHHLPGLYPPPTVARAGAGIMLTAILTASAILINRFFICKSPLIKICSADLPRQESRTHPLLFCPRWTNHQHHCNKFWSIWQCFKANCRISGKMAFQSAFRPEEGGDFSLTFAPVQHINKVANVNWCVSMVSPSSKKPHR